MTVEFAPTAVAVDPTRVDVRPKRAGAHRYVHLDSLRGVAALAVAVHHVGLAASDAGWRDHLSATPFFLNAWTFVDFFFVLSGFVISRAYTVGATLEPVDFLKKRFARVYPLHLFMLAAFVGLEFFKYVLAAKGIGVNSPPFTRNGPFSLLMNVFLLQSMGTLKELSWDGPSWSVSVEFYTYITFMAVMMAAQSLRRRWVLTAAALVIIGASYGVVLGAAHKTSFDFHYDFGWFRGLIGFFVGVLLNTVRMADPERPAPAYAGALQAGTAVLVLGFIAVIGAHPGWSFWGPLVFGFALFTLTHWRGSWVERALSARPLAWLGELSFSIYLVHAFVLIILQNLWRGVVLKRVPAPSLALGDLTTLIYLAVVLGGSMLTYRFVERPARDLLRSLPTGRRRPA